MPRAENRIAWLSPSPAFLLAAGVLQILPCIIFLALLGGLIGGNTGALVGGMLGVPVSLVVFISFVAGAYTARREEEEQDVQRLQERLQAGLTRSLKARRKPPKTETMP